MTITDPHDPAYADEVAVRSELTRTFGVCDGCRACVDLCTVFPTLFDLLDGVRDRDAGLLTPAEQDRIVDQCFHCRCCTTGCPYSPRLHERPIDVPEIVLRSAVMRRASGQRSVRDSLTATTLGRWREVGPLAAPVRGLVDVIARGRSGSLRRRALADLTGVTARRPLPSTRRRSPVIDPTVRATDSARSGAIVVVPGCEVDAGQTVVGDLDRLHRSLGIATVTASGACCGAVWLRSGDRSRFVRSVTRTVTALAAVLRSGADGIVVIEPACAAILTIDAPRHVDARHRADAELVAANVVGACEHVLDVLDRRGAPSNAPPSGGRAVIVVDGRSRGGASVGGAPNDSAPARLLRRAGFSVQTVDHPTGVTGLWDLRRDHDQVARTIGASLAACLRATGALHDPVTGGAGIVASESALDRVVLAAQFGVEVVHPISRVVDAALGGSVPDGADPSDDDR